ncbi:MAG: hypothetical protein HY240_06835 [Actinobacteria bacterium]|nr:hypothetical protein [Actinomycetota bacterium]
MYHLAAWMDDCADQLEAMRLGTFAGRVDTKAWIDEQNRLQFVRSREIEAGVVRGYLDRSRVRMLEAWRLLPEVTAEAWEWFEESGPLHYRKHLEDLRLWSGDLHGSGPGEP